jgi:hypothetical protein
MLFSCYEFALICCACDFKVSKLKSEGGENKFQLFLYLSQEIPARAHLNSSAWSALMKDQ